MAITSCGTGGGTPSTPTSIVTNTPVPPTDTAVTTNTAISTNTAVTNGTPVATDTPTETVTGTPPTATETPTACTLSFEDVPPGQHLLPLYPLSGMPGHHQWLPLRWPRRTLQRNNDPYFRPGNNVTSGQFAKIAANSAGFNEPSRAQQYEDVLPGSTFYDFIWRLTNRGLVNGYPCGGPGEPCGPANLPYFRPNANVTRGQIAKIDANAAGYNDPPGAQQYEDVLPGSTFYDFIWRLADRAYEWLPMRRSRRAVWPGQPALLPPQR